MLRRFSTFELRRSAQLLRSLILMEAPCRAMLLPFLAAAVLLLADRLYWEPFYRHGSLAVGLALAARLNPWRVLRRSKG